MREDMVATKMTGKNDDAESLEKSKMTNQELLGKAANRRGFISRVAGAVGAAATIPGLSSATDGSSDRSAEQKQELTELAREYASTGAVRRALRKYASEVVKTLHHEDYLEDASVRSMSLSEPTDPHRLDSSDGVVVAGAIQSGTPTAWIEVRRFVNGNRIVVVILPQLDRSYAVVRSTTTQNALATVSSDGTLSEQDGVSTMVEGHECCEYRRSPEGYEYCEKLYVKCWGETTDEGCNKDPSGSNCCALCSNCTDDCCMQKCGYY